MTPYYADDWLTVYHGDARAVMAEMEPESVNCVVTSPPYWGLRDYGEPGQLGLEPTPEAYVESLVAVFREVRRVLRSDGTVWLNLGDSYQNAKGQAGGVDPKQRARRHGLRPVDVERHDGIKPKDLVGIPWMVAFALRSDGWYLRSDIIWSKPNPMPESVADRPTRSHEYLFLLSSSARYWYDGQAVRSQPAVVRREPPERIVTDATVQHLIDGGASAELIEYAKKVRTTDKQRGHSRRHDGFNDRWDQMERDEQIAGGANIRSVWTVATQPYPGAHFATFPPKLIEPCIKAGCPEGGVVLDPFAGSGTTGLVAQHLSRRAVLIDLSMDYLGQLMERNRDIPLGLGA
jgi:site-specific DNA-methyltransferase (cytosine-N4-specific)